MTQPALSRKEHAETGTAVPKKVAISPEDSLSSDFESDDADAALDRGLVAHAAWARPLRDLEPDDAPPSLARPLSDFEPDDPYAGIAMPSKIHPLDDFESDDADAGLARPFSDFESDASIEIEPRVANGRVRSRATKALRSRLASARVATVKEVLVPQGEISGSSTNIAFSETENQTLNPHFLAGSVVPYLGAIADIQHVIDEVLGQPQSKIRIKSIKQESPISVSLDGAAGAVRVVQEFVVPWKRKHAEVMAQLLEQEKRTEIESKKAEILEKRAGAAKSRAEAQRFTADATKQHEETERLKLENEKLRLDLNRAKIQLALDILKQLAPELPETEKVAYVVRLLSPLGVIVSSDLEIATVTNASGAG